MTTNPGSAAPISICARHLARGVVGHIAGSLPSADRRPRHAEVFFGAGEILSRLWRSCVHSDSQNSADPQPRQCTDEGVFRSRLWRLRLGASDDLSLGRARHHRKGQFGPASSNLVERSALGRGGFKLYNLVPVDRRTSIVCAAAELG